MDSQLDVRLIDCFSRRFVPTEEGSLLAERATRIIAGIDEVEAELGVRRGEPSVSLRFSAPMEVGRHRIRTAARRIPTASS